MAKVVFDGERCKGCELCTTACPKKIVIMSKTFNKQGYYMAAVEEMDKCTGCGLCAAMCPDLVIEVYR